MAVQRHPYYCFQCGELIKEIHEDQSNLPPMLVKYGDTFIGYEHHTCKNKPTKPTDLTDQLQTKQELIKAHKELGGTIL